MGREREFAVASSVLDVDRPGAVLVTGAAGIGKTRLLSEVAAEAAGWDVERTTASTSGRSLPFAPFLHLQAPDAPPSQSPGEQLVRLRAELHRRVDAHPLLVIVDDAHLLDDASVLLLHQLVTRDPVAIALAARSQEPLAADLRNLVKDGHATRLDLDPLNRSESDRLVAALLDGPVDPALTDAIWRVAQGNPLFVRELIGAARGHGTLRREGCWTLTGPLGSSPLLREMIGQRLELLPDQHRAVLEALAVAGPLRWPVMERLASLDTIAELEAVGLITSPPGSNVIDAAHPLHAEVTRELAPTARLHAARRAVADAILASKPLSATDAMRVADLQLQSDDADPEVLVHAAGLALDQFDSARALRYSTTALALGGSRPDARLLLARARSASGDHAAAEREFTLLADLDLGDDWLIAVTIPHAQHRAFACGDVPAAIALLRARIERLAPDARAPLLGFLGYVAFFAGRFDDVLEAGLPLIALEPPPVDACQVVVTIWAIRGDPEPVLDLCSRALAGLRRHEEPVTTSHLSVANLLFVQLLALWQVGRAGDGDDPLGGLPDSFVLSGTDEHRLGMGAVQAHFRGHLDDSSIQYDQLGDGLLNVAVQAFTFNRTIRATTAAMRGDARQAREHLADVEATPPPSRVGFAFWIGRAGAWISLAEGDVQAAVRDVLALTEAHETELFHVTIGLHDIVRFGRPELVVDRLAVQAGRDGATWWDIVCADHARALRELDGNALLEVAARFEAGGLDLHAAETIAQAVRILGPGPGTAAASTRLAELLGRCGRVRTPALATLPPLLSTREHEVARLAASGLSNREIGDRLGTSARTVGNQLQQVYEKLGVHSRRELSGHLNQGGYD